MVSYTAWHPAGLDRWPHLHLDCACRCHICTGTGPHLGPATSAPGLGSPPPHLHRDWTSPCHICSGTGLTPPTSAPGLGSPRPHLRRDWARRYRIIARTAAVAVQQSAERRGRSARKRLRLTLTRQHERAKLTGQPETSNSDLSGQDPWPDLGVWWCTPACCHAPRPWRSADAVARRLGEVGEGQLCIPCSYAGLFS